MRWICKFCKSEIHLKWPHLKVCKTTALSNLKTRLLALGAWVRWGYVLSSPFFFCDISSLFPPPPLPLSFFTSPPPPLLLHLPPPPPLPLSFSLPTSSPLLNFFPSPQLLPLSFSLPTTLQAPHLSSARVKIDGANGVGADKLVRMFQHIPSHLLSVQMYNDGAGVLNERVCSPLHRPYITHITGQHDPTHCAVMMVGFHGTDCVQ